MNLFLASKRSGRAASPGGGALRGAALWVVLCLAAISCDLPPQAADQAPGDAAPDIVFNGFERREIEGEATVFVARAEKAEYYRDKGSIVAYSVEFEDRGADGKSIVSRGYADKAVYYEDSGDIEFPGFTRLESVAENAVFETTGLVYRASSGTLEGGPESSVVVKVGADLFLRGAGFFADIEAKTFAFRNGVSGVVKGVER